MRYRGVNRVYRIDEGNGEWLLYVAPTATAAGKVHAKRKGTKKLKNGQKPIEVAPDKLLTVSYIGYAEALHYVLGAKLDVIRMHVQAIPLADEFIGIQRAAEQWARMTPDGESRLLWSSAS